LRYAIVSDVHGNLEALEATLRDAAVHADAVVCLGDIVGYGADPGACLEVVADRSLAITVGNHDRAATGGLELSWFNREARVAAEWTHAQLDDGCRRYLDALPLLAEVGDALLVHASPDQPEEWNYLVSAEQGLAAFRAFDRRLCFVGHSHVPAVWSVGSSGPEFLPGVFALELAAGRRYLVNVGSVGQPRDRDPRASYALWDEERGTLSIRRVTYDVEVARRKIVAAGLPRFLGDRLRWGV